MVLVSRSYPPPPKVSLAQCHSPQKMFYHNFFWIAGAQFAPFCMNFENFQVLSVWVAWRYLPRILFLLDIFKYPYPIDLFQMTLWHKIRKSFRNYYFWVKLRIWRAIPWKIFISWRFRECKMPKNYVKNNSQRAIFVIISC